MSAIDLSTPVTARMIPAMKAAGIEAVCRYLSNSVAKNLSRAEAALLSAAGIKCVVVWESGGNDYANFNRAQGVIDAGRAIAQAHLLGVPDGACIYFCGDDFDATDAQIAAGITDYMRGVHAVMSATQWSTGVYGNGACCKAMLDAGIADKAWLWGASATNGTPAFSASNRWSIRQHPTINEFGASVDPDDVRGDYGGWLLPNAPVPPPAPVLTGSPDDPVKAAYKALQMALNAAGYDAGTVDGLPGPRTSAALAAWAARK